MSDSTTGQVLCATTSSVAGCVVLPNTGGDPILTAVSFVAIAAGRNKACHLLRIRQ